MLRYPIKQKDEFWLDAKPLLCGHKARVYLYSFWRFDISLKSLEQANRKARNSIALQGKRVRANHQVLKILQITLLFIKKLV